MKVEMSESGKLTVSAETPVEAFALNMWATTYFGKFPTENPDGPTLLINTSLPGKGCAFKADPNRDATPVRAGQTTT